MAWGGVNGPQVPVHNPIRLPTLCWNWDHSQASSEVEISGLQVHPTWNQQGGSVDKILARQDWRSTPKPPARSVPLTRSIGRGSCDRQLLSLPSLSKDSSPSWPALRPFSVYAPHVSLNKVTWMGRGPLFPIPDPWSPSGRAAVLISQQRKDVHFEKDSELVRMDQTPGIRPKPSDKYGELR